jgi:hypothetical protein
VRPNGIAPNKPNTSQLSQPGGLMATEGNRVVRFDGKLSNPTHPLYKHGPDVTDQYIYNRVANELVAKNRTGLRTAFNDRTQMESAISETFSLKQKEIDNWLASNPKAGVPQAFEANPGMGNLGRGYEVTTKGGSIEIYDGCPRCKYMMGVLVVVMMGVLVVSGKIIFKEDWPTKLFADMANTFRNDLKHYTDGESVSIPREAAAEILDRAIENYWKITGSETHYIRQFMEGEHGI